MAAKIKQVPHQEPTATVLVIVFVYGVPPLGWRKLLLPASAFKSTFTVSPEELDAESELTLREFEDVAPTVTLG